MDIKQNLKLYWRKINGKLSLAEQLKWEEYEKRRAFGKICQLIIMGSILCGILVYQKGFYDDSYQENHYKQYTEEELRKGTELNKLGLDYHYGKKGRERDKQKALQCFMEAADLGNIDALCNIGNAYKFRRMYEHSFPYYYRAAEVGSKDGFKALKDFVENNNKYPLYDEAQFMLAVCYENGYGVEKGPNSRRKAVEWYKYLAQSGYVEAQYHLGLCYYQGKGVSKDVGLALKWLQKAKSSGHENAASALEDIQTEIDKKGKILSPRKM